MSLQEKIRADLKEAMKQKNELLLLVLRGVMSAVHNKEIAKKEALSEDEVMIVLLAEAKKRKDAMAAFQSGGRTELANKEAQELEILKKYLPTQVSEEQVTTEAKKVIAEISATNIKEKGKIMGILMVKLKGQADGHLVGQVVDKLLKND